MAKRSPILGYNHNVRYRGLVFHVQTEDSGLQNPHLFTHLFYEGVIVSTRKYVYDAGSNEEAIKGLMQAQHKAVMKDLKKGTFDDKIDAYLGGTAGLEPRAGAAEGTVIPRGDRAQTEQGEAVMAEASSPIEIVDEELSEPIELPLKPRRPDPAAPLPSRTATGDRTIPVSSMRPQPPPPMDDAPTLHGSSASDVASAINEANAAPATSRTTTAQKVSRSSPADGRAATMRAPGPMLRDSVPVLEIVEDEESSGRRGPRDTSLEMPALEMYEDMTDGVPSRAGADSVPPQTTPNRPARPPSHGAATLPAGKPPARPMAPPVTRTRGESDPVEIYAPAPPSADPPPGERAERPGQYSVSRKDGAPIREKTGRIEAINPANLPNPTTPSSLGRPGSGPNRGMPPVPGGKSSDTGSNRVVPPGTRSSDTGSNRVVPPQQSARDSGRIPTISREATPQSGRVSNRMPAVRESAPPQQRAPTPPLQQRSPTPPPPPPQRPTPQARLTAPIANRTQSPATPSAGSGVVMTRPAVIVGAPPKPATPPPQRVRKAREEESRGFGQGLISEKSLDEVILAYLSEDAEDK